MTRTHAGRTVVPLIALALAVAGAGGLHAFKAETRGGPTRAARGYGAPADELRVMAAGNIAPAYLKLVAPFEAATGHKAITLATATGLGDASIPSRVRRGEPVDVVFQPANVIDELIADGHLLRGSRVDVARSGIGVAVRAGTPKPDISTPAALTRALLAARSVAYSAQVSGVYVSTELFERLGIAEQVLPKSHRVTQGMVADALARGEAEIGFQQISELVGVAGVDYVGPLPADVQRVTVFSAGIGAHGTGAAAGRALVDFLLSAQGRAALAASGLEPVPPHRKSGAY